MRDVGVGRSGGLTNWYLMNVADMWACVQDHQTEQHWRHVAGWRKVCDLAGQHLTRLRAYRDGLARAWPPETNAAAKAYVAELDDLIDQVQRTHDAASANQTALSAATQAITSTRSELSKIYEEYARKLQQKRTWETIAADPKAAAGSRASEPPVTDAELERLNIRARGIMYGLSSELQQAQAMLRQPPSSPRPAIQRNDPDVYGVDGPPPVIPPVIPIPTSAASATPQRLSPSQRASTPSASIAGPVLGASGPSLTPAPTNVVPNATPPPPTSPSLGPGIGPAPLPSAGTQPVTPRAGSARSEHQGRPATGTGGASPTRVWPPGGLIGGTPAMGVGQQPLSNTPRRVNPVGGIIGGGAAGTAPTGGAGSRPGGSRSVAGTPAMPAIGNSSGVGISSVAGMSQPPRPPILHQQKDDESRRWDPDQPWATDQGVSPIVKPPTIDGPIDPGPAIGLDR
ncbi:hypothetical protein [Micromonospora maris]|uniref:hypothetical protein n=1 Tax=Micromonospora maris TaxID=1003110 RepID=UPI002E12CCE7|nr:hypothetical protein OG712_07285 [Micromonospora maris]